MGQKAKATNYNAIALGDFANASGIGSTAVGDYAIASSHSTVAVGSDANATGLESIAIGHTAKGTGYQATAVGSEATAAGINALAAGFGSSAKGQFGGAFGSAAAADGDFATAAGYGANATANSATALGENSTASIEGGVALGSYSKTNVNSGVLGYDPSDKITTQEILLGDNKDTYDNLQNEIATAQNNVSSLATQILNLQNEYDTADATRRTEIINQIKSLNTQFLAARSDLQDKESAANKLVSTWQATGAAVSVGNSETGLTRQITNVAAGTQATDAVNVAQLTALNDKVDDNKISYVSINTKKDANKDNDQAGVPDDKSSRDAAVIGSNNITTGLGNWNLVATGFGNTIKNISYDAATDSVTEKQLNNAYVYGNENTARNGIAIGRRNVITGGSSSDNIAIGFNNKNYGERSVNLGNYTLTNGVDSIAVGISSKARKTDAIAIGGYTEANQVGAIVIGNGAVANTGGVALGYNSLADRSSGSIGYFTTLGSTEQAAIAEKLGKTAEYNQLVDTINGYSELAAQERQYRAYISERQNNEDLLSAEIENLYKNPEGSAAYNASLAKIREYQQKIKENNDGENSLSSIVSTNNPDYVKLQAARTDLRNMFAAYMSTADAVSVGNVEKGIYRQITGVAAGSEDTDAVNVAQLKDVGTTGLNFKGDGDTVVHRDLGATLNVVGGNTDADSLTDNNIGVVADATTGTLNVKLAKNLAMGDGSVTFAPTGKDADGNTLVQGQDGKWYSDLTDATYDAANNIYTKADGTTVSAVTSPIISAVNLSNTGLDNGNQKITNVAKGVDPTDAVNMEQFTEVSTKVDKGWTLAVGRGPDASSDYLATAKGEATKIAAGDTVTLQAGRGIKLKQDGAAVQIGLKYLDMDSAGSTYNDAVASAGGALAVGQNSVADGQQGVAIGYETHAGQYSFAGGTEAEANNSSVAIGDYAKANNSGSVAIGSGIRRVMNDPNSEYKKVDSEYGVAIGYETYVGEKSQNSTALGVHAKLDSSKYAVAIGNNATVSGSDYATAIGHNTNVTNVTNGVALGSYSIVNKGAGIVGYDASGADHSSDKTGTWKSTMGEVSIGQTNFTRQITNLAAGKENTDAVNVAQLKSVGSAGLNFKGDGDTVIHRDLGATLNVVGGNTDADSLTDNNIGVVADDTTGTLNVKLAKNLTMGDGSITFAPTGAKDAEGNTLVQGQDGKWYSDLTDATYDATNNVYTKSDGTPVSAVENPVVSSVKLTDKGLDNGGNKITNVAAGTVDTDIVNLGQLKGSTIGSSKVEYTDAGAGTITLTMQDGSKVTIDNLKDTYVKEGKLENNTLKFTRNDNTSFEVGDIASKSEMDTAVKDVNLKFTGDNTDDAAALTKKNGETLNILGGASEFTTANNIGVVADKDKGTLNVKLAKNISMGDGSVTFAPTGAKDEKGNNLVQGQDGKWYSDLTDATYDATNNVYTKADGTTVSAVENPVVSSVKLSNTGLDNGGNKITNVAAGTEDTDIVNLGQLKGSTIGSSKVEYTDAGAGTITLTMQDGSKVTIDSLKDTYVKEGKLANNTLTFTRNDNTSFEVGDIASKSDMDTAVGAANLKFTGDDTEEAATLTKKNGETLNIFGGAKEFTAADNIGVVKDGEALKVKLAKSISMGDGSVTFAPTGAKDAEGNALVQGQDGKWYSDLSDATYDATNNVYTKADGTTVSAVENPVVSAVKLTNEGLDNGGNKITNVAAGTVDTDIVNLGQLKGSTIGSSKVEYTDAGAGTITLTMQDGKEVKINGLKDTYVKEGKLANNTLTFTRNDNTSFEVGDIASKTDMDKAVGDVNLKFTGDDTSEVGTITKINGATLNILGGANEFTTANNIGVVKDGEALRVKLAKDVAMGDGSVTFANAKDDAGNTLVQGQDGKWYSDLTDATYDATNNFYTKADGTTIDAVENPTVSEVKLSNTGLDNGGNKITNVAAGTENTDIVNLGQLKGSTIKSSELKYTDAGVGTMTLTMQDGSKVEIGGLQDKYVTGASLDGNKLTITRNDDKKIEVDNIATTADIIGENSKVNLKFTGDDTDEDAEITKKNGETLNILGGAKEFTAADNIGVVADTDKGTLNVKLAKNISMGDGSVTFAPTGAKDAEGNALVQGQDGKWYSDLTDATYDATNNVYTNAAGTTIDAVENPTVSQVKLSNTGLDNGGNKITNVAAGTEDTDIVNLGQLKGSTIKSSELKYTDAGVGTMTLTMQDGSKVEIGGLQDKYVTGASLDGNKLTITRNDNQKFEVDKIATTDDIVGENSKVNLKFTGDDTTEDGTITKINGATLNVLGGASEFTTANNIGVVKDGDALRVKLAKNVAMGNGSVTFANAKDAAGNTLVQGQDGKWYSDLTDATYDATNNVYTNAAGTTIDAVENPTVSQVKLSNTGLDNGGNKITNVAAGTVDTDIVNLGQLKGSTIGSSKVEYTDAGAGTITLKMQDGHEVEIKGLQDKYVTGATFKDNTLTITRNDDTSFKVGDIASKTDMDSAVSNANLKFTGDDTSTDATITKKNGETLSIYGGVAATDADGNSLLSDVNNVGVVKTDNGLQIKLAKNLSGIDSARIGGTVKDGAATGGIYIANQSVTYNGSSKKTENGLYITGLANTDWNPTTDGIVSGRAATEDQLKAAYDGLSTTITANKIVAGDNITVTPLKDGSGTKVSLSDNLAFGDKNGKNIAINGKDGIISAGDGKDNQVVVDGANSTVTAGTGANKVTVDGTRAGITAGEGANKVAVDGTKGQVTIGEAGKGLVMGNQDVAVKNADGKDKVDENGNAVKESGKYITGLDNTTWNPSEKGYVPDRAATEGQLKDIVGQFDGKIDDINNAKRSFNSDTGEVINRGKDDVLDIKGGAKGELSEGNIGVVNNTGATGFDVKLAKDLKDLNSVTSNTVTTKELTVSEKANIGNVSISNDNVTIGTGDSKTVITNESVTTKSVTTGNTTINNDGLTVKNEDSSKNITVQNNNISMGGNVIHNVGDGVEATDAINKGQFDRTVNAIGTGMNQMSNRISKLDTRVDRVGAGAAALAALHPLEYNADEKWEISAGVGNYRGASAVAVGAFYRPNGNTLVSLGTSYGGGENMVNAGVTWRVGEGETGNYSSKQAMAQEISSLKSVVSDQSSQLQAQNSKIEAQSQQLEEQNKKIEQLMQAIAELKK